MKKAFISLIIIAILIGYAIIKLNSKIVVHRDNKKNTIKFNDDKFLYLVKEKNNGFDFYSYSLDGVDSPNSNITNKIGENKYLGNINNIDIPLVGFFMDNSHKEIAGLKIHPKQICFNRHQRNSVCINREGLSPIPVIYDYDQDGLDELTIYYFDTGSWYFYDFQSETKLNLVNSYSLSPYAYPFFLKNAGNIQMNLWNEDNIAYLKSYTYILSQLKEERIDFGLIGDIPFASDPMCNGDQVLGLYRRSNNGWYFRISVNESISKYWGTPKGFPLTGNFDGDRCLDTAIFDRYSKYSFYVLSSIFSDESLKIFPSGRGVLSNIHWNGADKSPPQLWPYKLYKIAKLKN